jgi:hypothetical protein
MSEFKPIPVLSKELICDAKKELETGNLSTVLAVLSKRHKKNPLVMEQTAADRRQRYKEKRDYEKSLSSESSFIAK